MKNRQKAIADIERTGPFGSVAMQDRQKAWMYDMKPTVKLIPSQETGQLITEVRATRYPSLNPLAGVGETLREAVDNAIAVNSRCC